MRCAQHVDYWVYADSGATTIAKVSGLTLGAESTQCADSQLVVMNYLEYQASVASPLALDLASATSLGSAILLVWGAALGIRVLIRMVLDSAPSNPGE